MRKIEKIRHNGKTKLKTDARPTSAHETLHLFKRFVLPSLIFLRKLEKSKRRKITL